MCACVSQLNLGSVILGLRGLKSGGAHGGALVSGVFIVIAIREEISGCEHITRRMLVK
jgi:hypothetical protein